MYMPPPSPKPCQNWTATITAAEQLSNVPRFLCDGQIARPPARIPQPAITGRRYHGSQPRPPRCLMSQIPLRFSVNGIHSANIGWNLSQKDVRSFETKTSDKTITATE